MMNALKGLWRKLRGIPNQDPNEMKDAIDALRNASVPLANGPVEKRIREHFCEFIAVHRQRMLSLPLPIMIRLVSWVRSGSEANQVFDFLKEYFARHGGAALPLFRHIWVSYLSIDQLSFLKSVSYGQEYARPWVEEYEKRSRKRLIWKCLGLLALLVVVFVSGENRGESLASGALSAMTSRCNVAETQWEVHSRYLKAANEELANVKSAFGDSMQQLEAKTSEAERLAQALNLLNQTLNETRQNLAAFQDSDSRDAELKEMKGLLEIAQRELEAKTAESHALSEALALANQTLLTRTRDSREIIRTVTEANQDLNWKLRELESKVLESAQIVESLALKNGTLNEKLEEVRVKAIESKEFMREAMTMANQRSIWGLQQFETLVNDLREKEKESKSVRLFVSAVPCEEEAGAADDFEDDFAVDMVE
jgi:hypothetical protein